MRRLLGLVLVSVLLAPAARADDPDVRVLEPGKAPEDSRLGKPRNLNDYFPMTVPDSKGDWEARSRHIREQVLVANGLWPMPEKARRRFAASSCAGWPGLRSSARMLAWVT